MAAAACGGDGNDSHDSLIPQRATLIGELVIDQLPDSPGLGSDRVFSALASVTPGGEDGIGELLTVEQAKSGLLFREVDRVDFFSDGVSFGRGDYLGVVVYGSFDEAAVVAEFESLSGHSLASEEYRGSEVHYSAEDPGLVRFSVLDSGTFALAGGGAIYEIIDIRNGDAEPKSGELISALHQVEWTAFRLAALVPDEGPGQAVNSPLAQFSDLPFDLDFFSAMETLALGTTPMPDSPALNAVLSFANEEAAESLSSLMSGLPALASGFSGGAGAVGLLDSLEVEQKGSAVEIDLEFPAGEFGRMIGDLLESQSTK